MTKDEIAVYLNDHLEFFNNYPELLGKIKSINNQDIPICKSNTLSMTGRLIKRAKEDKEKFKCKWLKNMVLKIHQMQVAVVC